MKLACVAAALAALLALATSSVRATTFFKEEFGGDWESRWVTAKGDKGTFKLSAGKFFGDETINQGLQTSQDAKFYAVSAKFDEQFSNEGKELVLQFSVKHEQSIDCGGGYLKLFPSSLTQEEMTGDSPYNIMFGPDICGPGTKRVHVIFEHKGENKLIKKEIRCKDDVDTHVYTLIVRPDNTYEVQIDLEKVEGGSLEEDWDMLPAKEILDPEASKPADWDDKPKIDDPEDSKPADWDAPEFIADPEAEKPDDWDDEMDGDWEAPQVENPEYKGTWTPKQIDNPNYQGLWVHPKVANPEYQPDDTLYKYADNAFIGIDIWQVKSGTIFDNIIITDSYDEAKTHAEETYKKTIDGEIAMRKESEEKERLEREELQKKMEEDQKKAEAEKAASDKEDEDFDDEEEEEVHDEL